VDLAGWGDDQEAIGEEFDGIKGEGVDDGPVEDQRGRHDEGRSFEKRASINMIEIGRDLVKLFDSQLHGRFGGWRSR